MSLCLWAKKIMWGRTNPNSLPGMNTCPLNHWLPRVFTDGKRQEFRSMYRLLWRFSFLKWFLVSKSLFRAQIPYLLKQGLDVYVYILSDHLYIIFTFPSVFFHVSHLKLMLKKAVRLLFSNAQMWKLRLWEGDWLDKITLLINNKVKPLICGLSFFPSSQKMFGDLNLEWHPSLFSGFDSLFL